MADSADSTRAPDAQDLPWQDWVERATELEAVVCHVESVIDTIVYNGMLDSLPARTEAEANHRLGLNLLDMALARLKALHETDTVNLSAALEVGLSPEYADHRDLVHRRPKKAV